MEKLGEAKNGKLEVYSFLRGLSATSREDFSETMELVLGTESSLVTLDSIKSRVAEIIRTSGQFDNSDVCILIEDIKLAIRIDVGLDCLPLAQFPKRRR